MKYLVVLGDGMADRPVPALGGRTPLEAAETPHIDALAQQGTLGMAKTVPEGMPPGSDTANLSVMGYDPRTCYSGRSPLEAVSMGIPLADDDVTFRCNLVTLSDEAAYEDTTMVDYSADEISTAEAGVLIRALDDAFGSDSLRLYPGISYRHCLVLRHGKTGTSCTPPHDITLKPVRGHLPEGEYGDLLFDLMRCSRELLRDHPVNRARAERGLRPATSCWFWGEGTKPRIGRFEEKFGVRGGVISAVDLIKGIGLCAGLQVPEVPGATGNLDTNFTGKADAALALLRDGCDFAYIHMEAPDECGHRGEAENKVKAIERIDRDVVGRLLDGLKGEAFSMLILPDHPTPISLRTHTADPVPFLLYRSGEAGNAPAARYTEALAAKTGVYVPEGHRLMPMLFQQD